MGGRELIASHPVSATILSGLNSLTGLTVWRHKRRQQRQLEAAGVPAAGVMQPGAAGEAHREASDIIDRTRHHPIQDIIQD